MEAKFQVPKSKNASGEIFKKMAFWPETHFKLFFIIFDSIERPVLYVSLYVMFVLYG